MEGLLYLPAQPIAMLVAHYEEIEAGRTHLRMPILHQRRRNPLLLVLRRRTDKLEVPPRLLETRAVELFRAVVYRGALEYNEYSGSESQRRECGLE